MSKYKTDQFDEYGLPRYFDMQAELAHTKHVGGLKGTKELLELCQMGSDKYLLNVGSGSGSTNIFIAETYGAKSFGVDIKDNMVKSAQERAVRHGVADLVEYRQASALDLPFDDNTFDIVISESVNVFIPDRAAAMEEYKRVTKPGGYIGLNEAIPMTDPTPEVAKLLDDIVGHEILPPEYWVDLLKDSGLTDIISKISGVTTREESRSQMGFFGKGDLKYLFKGMVRVLFKDPYTRSLVKQTTGASPKEITGVLGYGVFVGKKPG
jgi:ubiquinone/menaquinone biosynthesis C-methylase UbiE